MTTLVVDTDVVSFLLKDDTRAQLYLPHLLGKTLALSFMTVAELYQWAYIRRWGERRLLRLEEHLGRYLVAPFDNELCKQWAAIAVERQRLGQPISVQDAWVAATAIRYDAPLVTHNRDDFANITGLKVISED
jgi:tRNA(fMet)-specific endonuclease VapC